MYLLHGNDTWHEVPSGKFCRLDTFANLLGPVELAGVGKLQWRLVVCLHF